MKKNTAKPKRRRPAITLEAYQISPAMGDTRLYLGRLTSDVLVLPGTLRVK